MVARNARKSNMSPLTNPNRSQIDDIRAEADLVCATAEYLIRWPEDIKTEHERLLVQRQILLDAIDEFLVKDSVGDRLTRPE